MRWPIVGLLAPGILAGSLAGAQLAVALPAKVLNVVFATFLVFSATQMFRNRKPKPTRTLPGRAGGFAVGGVIGVLSSMVGAGGAFITRAVHDLVQREDPRCRGHVVGAGFSDRPGRHRWATSGPARACRRCRPVRSATCTCPALAVLSLASISTAPLGARTAHRMDISPLRKMFALVLFALAAYLLLR